MSTCAPPSGRLDASASPPCARATARTIASPSPLPPSSRAGGVGAPEAFEGVREKLGWESGPAVTHCNLERAGCVPGAELDRRSRSRVANRVREEIVDAAS